MRMRLALFLALLCAALLAGCSGDSAADGGTSAQSGGNQPQSKSAEIKGETYDAGHFSVLVPDGWLGIVVNDMWADDPSAIDPDQLNICKGARNEADLLSNPSVHIVYYDSATDMMRPSSDYYKDVEELEPITAGDRTWEGITGTSQGAPLAILWTGESGEDQFQVTVWLEMEGETISLEDGDVQAILASILPSSKHTENP